jgi:hypothetical protein
MGSRRMACYWKGWSIVQLCNSQGPGIPNKSLMLQGKFELVAHINDLQGLASAFPSYLLWLITKCTEVQIHWTLVDCRTCSNSRCRLKFVWLYAFSVSVGKTGITLQQRVECFAVTGNFLYLISICLKEHHSHKLFTCHVADSSETNFRRPCSYYFYIWKTVKEVIKIDAFWDVTASY